MRPTWRGYFGQIARVVASRSTCSRAHVGCVLVSPVTKAALSMGYNGSVRGQPHCDDVGHDMLEGSCVRTLHAETNAIAQAAANGTRISGAWAYVTHYPCRACAKLLVNAGIEHVLYENDYRVDARASKTFYLAGINPEKLHLPPAPSELANELLELRARIARLDPGKAPTEVK